MKNKETIDYWYRLSDIEKKELRSQACQAAITKEHAEAYIKLFGENPELAWAFIAEFNSNPIHHGKNDIVPVFGFSHQILLQCELATVDGLKKRFHLEDKKKENK